MNKALLVVLVIVLIAFGWYAYTNNKQTQEAGEWKLAASFMCEDDSYFIAEFPEEGRAEIIVDGTVTQTLTLTAGLGQRFENDAFVYVFAGEEATVTNKATGYRYTCSQPVDPNNAPVNFGDTGEGAGEAQDTAAAVSANIVGKWQDMDDPLFVREFKADGTIIDKHDGVAASPGLWKSFTAKTAVNVSMPLEADSVYVEIGSEGEVFYYKIGKLTLESLEMIYADGGVLVFERVQ